MKKEIKIIITDDHKMYREALKNALLDHHITTIAESGNGHELLRQLQRCSPDVVLLDLNMPGLNGNDTMAALSRYYPQVKVIVLSQYAEQVLMDDYIIRGASGYVPKDVISNDLDELLAAIAKVCAGGIYKYHQLQGGPKYSVRHKQIMGLTADGRSEEQIAQQLGLTRSAITKAAHKLKQALGTANKKELRNRIFDLGLNFLGRPQHKGRLK